MSLRREIEIRTGHVETSPRIHKCSACGTNGPWTDSWCWYGSYEDEDRGLRVPKMCSEACKQAWYERNRLFVDADAAYTKSRRRR